MMTKANQQRAVESGEKKALVLKARPTTFRTCLMCEGLMYSTGPDHRLCNPCTGQPDYTDSPVGKRCNAINRRKGKRP